MNKKAIIDSINHISKTLPGKYLNEEMTLVTVSCIKDQDSLNYPGILRSFPPASLSQADFLS